MKLSTLLISCSCRIIGKAIALLFLLGCGISLCNTFIPSLAAPLMAAPTQAQQRTISGKVIDGSTDNPLPGVNVVAKGTTTGTVTDTNGNFSLTVSDEAEVLVFSSIGFVTEEVSISGLNSVAVSLIPDIQSLLEVVVTASKRNERLQDVPGSIQALTGETVDQIGIRDINEVLAFVPGASEDLSFGAGLRQYQLRGIPQGPGYGSTNSGVFPRGRATPP